MKRLIAGFLSVCVAVSLLMTGCSSGGTDNTAQTDGPVTITIWHDKEEEVAQALQTELDTLAPDIVVKLEKKDGLTDSLKMVGNDPNSAPDMYFFAHDKIGVYAEMGILAPITDFVDKSTLDQYIPMTIEAATYKGEVYQLPLYFETLLYMYNRRYMSDDEVPSTTEELYKYMQENTKGGHYGFVEQHSTAYYAAGWLHAFGGYILNENGEPGLDDENTIKALEYHKKFVELMPTEGEYSTVNTLFREGKAHSTIGGPWLVPTARESGIDLGIAPMPTVDETGNKIAPYSGVQGIHVLKVAAERKHDAIAKVLQVLTNDSVGILFLAEMQHGVGFDNPHLFEIMAGVENALSEKGYGLTVQHSTALDLWQHFDELLQGSYVDGVILHASVVSKDVALCLAHTELPYIVVGAPDFSNQLCWIDTNNSVAGQIAVTHLWRNGYDRIAFIGGPKEDTISAHRLSGALATLNEKIPAGYLREGPPTSEGGAAAARALLELQTRPNAVICANQYIAFGCVNELKDSGIRIPEDMAVITFDDFPFSKIIEPQLSVVNLDMYDMGEQAAKVVLRRIRTPQYLVQSQTTLPILIERQSTKKLP